MAHCHQVRDPNSGLGLRAVPFNGNQFIKKETHTTI